MEESKTIRIFNPNFKGMYLEKLKTLIEKADLPSLGYKKITETKMETDFKTGLISLIVFSKSLLALSYFLKYLTNLNGPKNLAFN